MRVLQLQSRLFRLDSARLDEENAGDDLQTIGDTVLHLLQQHVLFSQEFLHLLLNSTPGGDVLERGDGVPAAARALEREVIH